MEEFGIAKAVRRTKEKKEYLLQNKPPSLSNKISTLEVVNYMKSACQYLETVFFYHQKGKQWELENTPSEHLLRVLNMASALLL